jgi:hypothetical protein
MKLLMFILILIALASAFAFQQPVVAQVVVPNSVFGNGGDAVSDSRYHIVGTLGQAFIGVAENPSSVNSVGFWYLATHTLITDVEQTSSDVPKEYRLEQNYPNPFNPTTIIRYEIAKAGRLSLRIYNVSGALVKVLEERDREPGRYEIGWDGNNEHGEKVSSGVYFYRLTAPGFSQTRKMLLLK